MAVITYDQRKREIEDRERFNAYVQRHEDLAEQATRLSEWTRELVYAGLDYRENVIVGNRYFTLRPLTDIEFLDIQRQLYPPNITIKEKRELDQNYHASLERERKLIHVTVAKMLTLPEHPENAWIPDDVAKLPMGVPRQLFNRGSQISAFPPIVMITDL